MDSADEPGDEPHWVDSWQAAERSALRHMRAWGHADAILTAAGRDGGIDIRARTALAQVKWEAAQVGAPAVQRLVGARGRDHHLALYFFAASGYAKPAVEYADTMDVALFTYSITGEVSAINGAADGVLVASRTRALDAFPLEAVERWADAARANDRAVKAASAGPLRRHWPLIVVTLLAVILVDAIRYFVSGSTPQPRDEGYDWYDPLLMVGLGVALVGLWRFFRRRRNELAPDGVPKLRPEPAIPSGAIDATNELVRHEDLDLADAQDRLRAVKALRSTVTGMSLVNAQTLINRIADSRS